MLIYAKYVYTRLVILNQNFVFIELSLFCYFAVCFSFSVRSCHSQMTKVASYYVYNNTAAVKSSAFLFVTCTVLSCCSELAHRVLNQSYVVTAA